MFRALATARTCLLRRNFSMDTHWLVVPEAPVVSTDCRTGKVANDPSKTDLVIYHADCTDGFAAAFAAWKLLGDRAQYVAANHGPDAPRDLDVRGKHVVVADYCFPASTTRRMIEEAASFIVLDHHFSAQKELAEIPEQYKVFEMKQSGATLSWNYFHGADVPLFYRYIEDKDIWRWAFRESKAFSAGFLAPLEFGPWDEILRGGEDSVNRIIMDGKSILSYRNSVMSHHVERALPCKLKVVPEFNGMVVNATTLISDIGNAIATRPGVDYGLMWFYDHKTKSTICSLRSASDAVDVSAIAKQFGGGGHKRAAGFTLENTSIESILC